METHPGHPRDALPGGGHCSPASVSLSFPLCPRRGYVGTGPPVQAWSPVAAAPIPDTQGPGVCPRAACGGASQGLPRPLVPPLPQTQTPRVSAVLPQGAEPSPGPGSPAPTPCVVTLTCLPLTERTRPCTHACGPKGHPPPVPQRQSPSLPCALCSQRPQLKPPPTHGSWTQEVTSHQFSRVRLPTGQRRGRKGMVRLRQALSGGCGA